MTPVLTTGGQSFKGAALYYLHDKRLAGETERLTGDRVAWTHTINLATDDPERAWRMMAHTAMAQSNLKMAAGIKATGRKLEKPVMAYSLAWHPDETSTKDEMMGAAIETLKILGLADHQTIIVCHNDTPHPHVHILVNRVHPETGIAAKLGNSKLKLSNWALDYETRRGRIYCEERVENHARRQGLRPGEKLKGNRRLTPEDWQLSKTLAGRKLAAAIRAAHATLFGDQIAAERYQQRRRVADEVAFYRQRREGRASVKDRRAAIADAASHPEKGRAYARMAELLTRANPALSLAELTRNHSTFTRADLARLVGSHTDTAEQFVAVMAKLESSDELVRVGRDEAGRDRFTTKSHQGLEKQMERHARLLHAIKRPEGDVVPRWSGKRLSGDQEAALHHVLAAPGLTAVIGYAGSGKSTMLDAARQSWERAGYRVVGATLSGIAADGLKNGAGIDSRTIHSRLYQWEQGQSLLTAKDVLVVDEAGMIGSRQMERLLSHALQAKAKVVLVGDPQQLQAIEAGAAFRAIVDRVGAAELNTVRRQKESWQQDATRELATGRVAEAVKRYEVAGMVHEHQGQGEAMQAAIDAWHKGREEQPGQTQIILAYTRKDVRDLNELAREKLRADGTIGRDVAMKTEAGPRNFALNDRVYFLKNDAARGVRNGSLGTIERVAGKTITVRLDGDDKRRVTFSIDQYGHIDHGYAATIHKSQGVTVDRAHLVASRNLDRHSAYVAMTRHRDRVDLHWARETIPTRARLDSILSRERSKDTSLDYAAEIEAGEAARQQTIDALQERIQKRAKAFNLREATLPGRFANARALAGKDAGPVDVARLALDGARRSQKFRQQQATLKGLVQHHGKAGEQHIPGEKPVQPQLKEALIAFDRETERLVESMRSKHDVQRRSETVDRKALQAQAARTWREGLMQAETLDALDDLVPDHARNDVRMDQGQEAEQGKRDRLDAIRPALKGPTLKL